MVKSSATDNGGEARFKDAPPILFMVFCRPDKTAAVFDSIRAARPRRLFIAADGPRQDRPDDEPRCAHVRAIVSNVDWPCEVKTLFRTTNLGCGRAVSEALQWFFTQVEEGIILEDDTVPDASFFSYCAELLDRYRHDTRVMSIGGYNPLTHPVSEHSYYFSTFFHCWGWATWRRVAQLYDFTMADFPEFKRQNIIASLFRTTLQQRVFQKQFDWYHRGGINNWDTQWVYMILKNNGLCINPNLNLVRNIGFGKDSTFAANQWSYHGRRSSETLSFPLIHPDFMVANAHAVHEILRTAHGVWLPRILFVRLAMVAVRIVNFFLHPFKKRIF